MMLVTNNPKIYKQPAAVVAAAARPPPPIAPVQLLWDYCMGNTTHYLSTSCMQGTFKHRCSVFEISLKP